VQISTDYNDAKSCSECFALQPYNAGDQVLCELCEMVNINAPDSLS